MKLNIAKECGTLTTWKRIQGSNGKYQAFGFRDFEEPQGTLRALRVLRTEGLFRSNANIYGVRLSEEMANKLEFISCQSKANAQDNQFEWFSIKIRALLHILSR
ncbi:hypothetical protein ANCCAN_08053 [Ancylostoma caninum]|uniref:RRM domain-containing protein n=1 Tax=Ancylostoma caninum TaxID=29170 RepID=A0A368GQL7_ANCCA|nr:hypothetical protein ANCCAN_08053 [Ancylostoma caninum]